MSKLIHLTKGKVAIVDDDNYERLSRHKWYFCSGYAVRTVRLAGKKHTKSMHREIMHAPTGLQIDHINGNKLDNRKDNLRVATRSQNMCNCDVRRDSKSGLKGVSWYIANKKWRVRIWANGRGISLGYYSDLIEAAKEYDKAALTYYGEFARLNEKEA